MFEGSEFEIVEEDLLVPEVDLGVELVGFGELLSVVLVEHLADFGLDVLLDELGSVGGEEVVHIVCPVIPEPLHVLLALYQQ